MGDGDERQLQWHDLGDEVVVLDDEGGVVHRLSTADAVGLIDANGVLTRRRVLVAIAAGVGISTVALPSAAAAASNDGILDPGDTPASTPSGVSASSLGPTSIFVSWTPLGEVSGYYVLYGTTDPPTTAVGTSTSGITITGLTAATTYFVQVLAWNDASPYPPGGPTSPAVTVTTDSVPGPLAAAATTAEVDDGTLTISWTDGTSGSHGYKVYWRKVGTSSWGSKPNATSPTVITGLDAGFTYEYYVARTGNGWESPAPASPEVSPVIPVPDVTGFAAGTNITNAAPGVNLKGFTWMRLTWDAATGASPTYQVQRFLSPNWTNVGSPTASTSAVVTGLDDNSSQQFRIVTVINGNSSSGSSSSTDTTHRAPTVTGAGNTVVRLGTAPDHIWECDLITSGSVTTYGPDVAASYLVVGGGGGGGGGRSVVSGGTQRFGGGGGGAGAVVSGSTTLGAGTYSAVIGTGGSAGSAGGSANAGRGGDGGESSLSLTTTLSAAGGGGGGGAAITAVVDRDGNGGACGGGAGAGSGVTAAGGPGSVASDGAGTSATASSAAGGIGGGASGSPDGTPTRTGTVWAAASGGDGVTYGTGGTAGPATNTAATAAATAGSGGGGGGGGNQAGAAGAAGIVIVRVSEYAR